MDKDGLKSASFGRILWRIDPFLDSDREANNERTFAPRQQILISKKAASREWLSKHFPTAADSHARNGGAVGKG
jgi:hypothetical protein